MYVDRLTHPIGFDVDTAIDRETSEIIHLEPVLHLTFHLQNETPISNVTEFMDIQNDCVDDFAMILKDEQYSVGT